MDDDASFGSFCLTRGEKKDCLIKAKLNKLQNELLREFFAHDNRFYLTGGAALVGFYLGHRETNDLDLFTLENEIENGFAIVKDVARSMGARVEAIQTAPDFRRLLVTRDDEAVVVDLVRECVFQIESEKREIDNIRIDSPEEIFANKLCALLSRSEIRDLVDVRELEKAGFNFHNALTGAQLKDTGLTPAQLAWVLSQIKFGDDLNPPGNVSVIELQDYVNHLIARLNRLAFPE